MKDRSAYYQKWYLQNKEAHKKKVYAWLKAKRKELGTEGFKQWKSEQNVKHRSKQWKPGIKKFGKE